MLTDVTLVVIGMHHTIMAITTEAEGVRARGPGRLADTTGPAAVIDGIAMRGTRAGRKGRSVGGAAAPRAVRAVVMGRHH